MNLDPGILCFQHCETKVFSYNIPNNCPICKCDTRDENFKILPFRYPYPFIKAWQYPCAVVIRPTNGDFLNDYENSSDLHIGITNSDGHIIEFDSNGLTISKSPKWNQSLLVFEIEEAWHEIWNKEVVKICSETCWKSTNYNENTYNCFTFVLTFLSRLNYGYLRDFVSDKLAFCKNIIVPQTTIIGQYICIYRQLKDNAFAI